MRALDSYGVGAFNLVRHASRHCEQYSLWLFKVTFAAEVVTHACNPSIVVPGTYA